MRGALPPLPNTPSWRGAQLKNTGTTLPLEVKNAWSFASSPPYVFTVCFLITGTNLLCFYS
jgi:hypothetical protein